ncbi:MAG: hypothetical protein Q8K97_09405 [Pseudohongiella sp.]|nr:hypothetical protein [Pseudohongiella sp.]
MNIAANSLFVTLPHHVASYSTAVDKTRIGVLTQLYIWSIIFEPLLLFLIGSQASTGIGLNFGRLLQLLVLTGLLLRFVMNPASIRIPNPFNARLRPYFLFILYTIFAGVLGLLLGKYAYSGQVSAGQSIFASINTPMMRPIWEYVTLIFQFVYFILLAPYFLRGEREVSYFFKAFTFMAILHLVVGFIDYGFSVFGVELVPRHLSDWRHVGVRLHGIAGEPRDAFVHMIAIMFIFGLKALRDTGQVNLSKKLVVTIIVALLLTQSASGILGLIIAMMLITVFGFNKISVRRIASLVLLVLLGGGGVYIAILSSERLQLYLTYASVVQELFLDSSIDVPLIVQTQYNNIYPLIELYNDVLEFNPMPVLFGSGLGSSGFANSRTPVFETLANPHSQITRTIFETGLLGTFMFIYAFRKMLLSSSDFLSRFNQQRLLWLFLLLLGCYFAHRSTHLMICTGVLYAVTLTLRKREVYTSARY